MTAVEVFQFTSKGGATDFERVIEICRTCGPYCLIGGLAVNCFVEPVYTLDADFVIASTEMAETVLRESGFTVASQPYTINAQRAASQLRIQFTKDPRYQTFPSRSAAAEVLGIKVQVACLEDLVQGKLWAYGDPQRRFSKRKKDELDLIRLAESYPTLLTLYPQPLQDLITSQ